MRYFWLLFVVFLVGCGPAVEFVFEIDNGEDLNGDVYIDGVFVGSTVDGSIAFEEAITGEKLTFTGEYFGRVFNQTYILPTEIGDGLVFSTQQTELESFTFYSTEDGTLFLNNKNLGNLAGGQLVVPLENLFPGTLVFMGERDGEEFEIEYPFGRESLSYYSLSLEVSQEYIDDLLFDVDNLDEAKIARLVHEEVNRVRALEGLSGFSWDDHISIIAKEYSEQQQESGFHHTDDQGRGVKERLEDSDVFFLVAGENLYFTDGLGVGVSEENIAKDAVEGWLGSPGHRALLLERDDLYTHAGYGVHCVEKRCYVTLNVIGAEMIRSLDMKSNSCTYITLFDETHPYQSDIVASIDIESDENVQVWIGDDEDSLQDCVDQSNVDGTYLGRDDSFDSRHKIEKGNVLLFEADMNSDIDVRVSFR